MKKISFLKLLPGVFLLAFLNQAAQAQKSSVQPKHEVYFSGGFDGNILSSAIMQKNGGEAKMTTPRFTIFFNIGANINYDFSRHFGIFSGLNIKNIGFIEKQGDITIKRRDYTFGIPIGLKIGNVVHGNYVIVGGGIDFPFNYREKRFKKRSDKAKFNEWFSDRVPAAMGYVFIGTHLQPGLTLKLQYYPGNFLNPDFTETVQGLKVMPYAGYQVNMLYLTFGINIPFFPKKTMEKYEKQI